MWRVPLMVLVFTAVVLHAGSYAALLAFGAVLCALELRETVRRS